ncbi:tautomerase family protein [Arthrobacter sp. MP_2.3]|uniref:tautomerase family protein n=1 Tax=Arthrobacter sp. MP_2.3 TaxID=3349633 RepID=UPI0038D43D24
MPESEGAAHPGSQRITVLHRKKRQLLTALTATYAEVMEIRPDTIRVVLHQLPRENWSVAGVTLADSGQNESICTETAQ